MPSPLIRAQIDDRLEDLYRSNLPADEGHVVAYYDSARGYYPSEEAAEERDRFAICFAATDGDVHAVGDHSFPFPLQSISKVFVYGLALADNGRENVLRRVGVEPSGDAFHSLVFDERRHRPHNPMVNAGALITTDLVHGPAQSERLQRILAVLRGYAANDSLQVDEDTLRSELLTADRNRATAYLMRSEGMLDGNVEDVLTLYLQQCSVHVTCRDLAVMAATLANGCVNPVTGERVLPRDRVRDVLSVMHTCGMYDAAGQWAYDVGLPAKSGVSGAIMAVVPGKGGVAVYSPGLDFYGNSVRGIRVCEQLSEQLGLHVFATEEEDAMLKRRAPVQDLVQD